MKNDYVKVLLYAYPSLPRIAEAVGTGAENKAFLSFRAYGSAFGIAERVVEEILVKNNLERVYCALREAVSRCTDQEKFLLEYKYFRRKRELKDCDESALSERTYYRRQQRLLKKIAEQLAAQDWTEENCKELFDSFAPFRKLYAALCAGRERQLTLARKRREVRFKRAGAPKENGA